MSSVASQDAYGRDLSTGMSVVVTTVDDAAGAPAWRHGAHGLVLECRALQVLVQFESDAALVWLPSRVLACRP